MIDMMMFSLNPAYNLECGDEYGIGTANERAALLRRAQTKGVGVSVMKPFHGGHRQNLSVPAGTDQKSVHPVLPAPPRCLPWYPVCAAWRILTAC